MTAWNPDTTPNFQISELACKCGKCGGQCQMQQEFMDKLQAMRDEIGPLHVTSGYRCPLHKHEKKKGSPGSHGQGTAADVECGNSGFRYEYVGVALSLGMVGIGLGKGFLHVDSGHETVSRPAIWMYK